MSPTSESHAASWSPLTLLLLLFAAAAEALDICCMQPEELGEEDVELGDDSGPR
jgi:hypothetical protein